jgi:Icc-related predicted phosphoesterase
MKRLVIHTISDTHGKYNSLNLPGGDILIHAGDATGRGTVLESIDFMNWLKAQPYTNVVFIAGNHDKAWEQNGPFLESVAKDTGLIYLNDSGTEIEGIKIHGSPVQPRFNNWSFNRDRGSDIKKHWDLIPEDTELLITHGPAQGILDKTDNGDNAGCHDLLDRIVGSKIKLHICGHIHEGRGTRKKHGVLFVNAACLNEYYQMYSSTYHEIVREEDGSYTNTN